MNQQTQAQAKRTAEPVSDVLSGSPLKMLLERSADATLLIDDKQFVDCNQAALEMLGFTSKESVLSRHPSELSPTNQPNGNSSLEKTEEALALAIAQETIALTGCTNGLMAV
jgi:PAS domain-containing protein